MSACSTQNRRTCATCGRPAGCFARQSSIRGRIPSGQERALEVTARHLPAAGDPARPGLRAAAEWLSPALSARAAELLGPPEDAPARYTEVLPEVPAPRPVPGPAVTAAEVAQEVAAVVAGDQDVAVFERAL